MKKLFVPLLILMLASCASPLQFEDEPDPSPASAQLQVSPGELFRLPAGHVARVEGTELLIAFHSVESDSRCAADTTCVWAGDAALYIGTAREGSRWSWSILHTGMEPRTRRSGDLTITVERLEPENRAGVTIPPASYVALLRVTRG